MKTYLKMWDRCGWERKPIRGREMQKNKINKINKKSSRMYSTNTVSRKRSGWDLKIRLVMKENMRVATSQNCQLHCFFFGLFKYLILLDYVTLLASSYLFLSLLFVHFSYLLFNSLFECWRCRFKFSHVGNKKMIVFYH